MARINISKVIDKSKFNKYFLTITLLCTLALALDGYDIGIYGPTLPSIMNELGLNTVHVGMLASIGMIGMMFGALFFGFLSDRLGRKRTVVIGIILYSVFSGLIGFTHTFNSFAICRFLAGCGMGALTPVCMTLLSEYSPKSHRTLILTLVMIGLPLGQLASATASYFFIESSGWRILYIVSFAALLVIPIFWKIVPESMRFYVDKNDKKAIKDVLSKTSPEFKQKDDDVYELNAINTQKASIASLFKSSYAKNTILIWIMFFCNLYLFFGLTTWLPQLMKYQGYSIKSSIASLVIFLLGGVILSPLAGYVSSKVGYKVGLAISYIVAATTVILLIFKANIMVFYVLYFFAGAAASAMQQLTLAIAPQFYPIAFRGTAMGWGSAVSRLGSAVAPILVGFLLQMKFSITTVFATFAIPAAIAFICAMMTRMDAKSVEGTDEEYEDTPVLMH